MPRKPQPRRRPARSTQARKVIEASNSRTISMTPAEQLEFWNALHAPVVLTASQNKLGKIMRGEL